MKNQSNFNDLVKNRLSSILYRGKKKKEGVQKREHGEGKQNDSASTKPDQLECIQSLEKLNQVHDDSQLKNKEEDIIEARAPHVGTIPFNLQETQTPAHGTITPAFCAATSSDLHMQFKTLDNTEPEINIAETNNDYTAESIEKKTVRKEQFNQ